MEGHTASVGALVLALLGTALPAQEKDACAPADNAAILHGNYRRLHSELLGEDRTVLVRLPEDYGKTDRRYPVLYRLDGDKGVFLQTFSAVYYLVDMTDEVPDHIIVAIENTDRGRDMVPGPGADLFIAFIKTELIPFIERTYRTDGFRILCAQSASSVLAVYGLLKQPDLFDGFVLGSFGLYRKDQAVLFETELKRSQEVGHSRKKYIFVGNGRRDAYDPDGSTAKRGYMFLESLQRAAPDTVLLKTKVYEDEGHVPFPSVYDGLRWIYSETRAASKGSRGVPSGTP